MKLFEFDVHIGDWRVLVQTNDIQNGAIKSRHITDNAVTNVKIGDGEVKSRNIQDDAVTTAKIGDGEVKTRNIGKEAVTNEKIADDAITGDEIQGSTVKNGKIANNAVQTRNIKDRNVTGPKIGLGAIQPNHFERSTFWQLVKPYVENLQNQIDSLEVSGIALANVFGNDPHIGINQQRLTSAINQIWAVLEQITGNTYLGFTMVCDHDYFISETVETITLTATPSDPNGYFEHVAAYNGNTLIAEAENVNTFTCQAEITDTSTFRIVGKLLGVEYTRQHTVIHYNSFFLGAGTAYTDVLNVQHVIPIANNMRGAYNVTAADDDHLFVIVGESLAEGFIRADMNGIEIAFTESTVTVGGKTYKVFTSGDTYQAGTYNIDING